MLRSHVAISILSLLLRVKCWRIFILAIPKLILIAKSPNLKSRQIYLLNGITRATNYYLVCLSDIIDCAFSLHSLMCLRGTIAMYVAVRRQVLRSAMHVKCEAS